jgi:MFS family permease
MRLIPLGCVCILPSHSIYVVLPCLSAIFYIVQVSSKASLTVLYANTATYLPGLLTTGFYSSVANIYGRKIVMIISLFGLVIYAFLFAFVVFNEPAAYMEIIIVASFCMGITGTYTTFMMGAFSYVADTTDPAMRTRAYSIAESCLYVGKIVGPLTSGFWAQSFGFRVPFAAAAVAAGLCIVYITFFVKESLFLMKERQTSLSQTSIDQPRQQQHPKGLTSSDNCEGAEPKSEPGLLFNPMQTYYNLRILFRHKVSVGQSPVPFIAIAFFFFHFSLMGFMQVVYVYMKYEYDWNSLLIGLYDSMNGIIQVQITKCLFSSYIFYTTDT